ncbi:winged helix-turn-helix transcriptional regulator [Amycolatopsis saalfeldensis]|uniref:DNA-binding transcriptional regulator, HxlR family n=1 Tax=Amycolatopsis saalfeldensis TaxID=394193 RepID=A0A1H8Y9B7_9PSEU|nr:helix-turn-helix domain-containing protein [Amycolatopsis saalfeldensis]SEP48870.1 DNA-binding transcriptional regulator, HxlR family [Amycolatopsis saalfeldensis]
MSLPSTYADRNCSLARALEIVGERWTLLIVRDAFYGLRRFGDFAAQLGIPRAVLTNRLKFLVREGVLAREDSGEYVLTDKGVALWPIIRTLINWGDEFYSPAGVRRTLRHDTDGARLDHEGRCEKCGVLVPAQDTRIEPGPGFQPADAEPDPMSAAINSPRRLLEPLSASRTSSAG